MERRFNFTKASIGSIEAPTDGKKAYFYDTDTRGLELQVTPAGMKVFYFYRKFKGTPIRIRIGPYPEMTHHKARAKAHEFNSCIVEGIDPRGIGPSIRSGLTLEELFEVFLNNAKRPVEMGGKKTWQEDERQFNCSLKKLRHRKITAITRTDLQNLYDHMVSNHGIYSANRLNALLKTLFNFGYKKDLFVGKNPAMGVEKLPEKSRSTRLESDQLPKFFRSLRDEPNEDMSDIFLLLLFTGARKSNVLEMKWDEIDWEKETWVIPRTKNNDPLIVPLVDRAIEILQKRRGFATTDWVFPGIGKTGHIKEVKTAWKRVVKRAGIEGLRVHDLRRTHASIQADLGIDLLTIGKSLGHRTQAATMVYARPQTEVVRDAKRLMSEVLDAYQDDDEE